MLISGDHLLGRISLFYEYGCTADPVGEFLRSLDLVDALDARLALSGHGRPFTDVHAHIEANRKLVRERLEAVRGALAGEPRTRGGDRCPPSTASRSPSETPAGGCPRRCAISAIWSARAVRRETRRGRRALGFLPLS